MVNVLSKPVLQLYTPILSKYARPKTGASGALQLRGAAGQSPLAAALASHLETSLISGANHLQKSPAGFYLTLAELFPQAEYMSLLEVPLPPGRRVKARSLKKLAQLLANPAGSRLLNYQADWGRFQLLGLPPDSLSELLAELPLAGWPASPERENRRGRIEFCRGLAACPWPLIDPARLAARLAVTLEEQGYDFSATGFRVAVHGCGGGCLKAFGRYDLVLNGTWRGDLILDSQAAFSYLNHWAEAVSGCPAGKLAVDGGCLTFNKAPCRRCGRCRRRLPLALRPPENKGLTIWAGGREPAGRPPGRPRILQPFQPLPPGAAAEKRLGDLLAGITDFWFRQKDDDREFLAMTLNRLGLARSLPELGLPLEPAHLA